MAELLRAIRSEDEVEIWKQLTRDDIKELVNYQSKSKLETPLFCASMKGNVIVVSNLLAKGARVGMKTNWGATPLHAASEMGRLETVKLLVTHHSPLNHQTQFGDTPIHLAAYRGHLKVVKCLVEAGSDIFIKNSERRTVLDEASAAEHAKIVRYLDGILFGDDMKPILWKTPYSDDPMVTTHLMQPDSANSYHTSPRQKLPVGRSRSTPFTEKDKARKEKMLLNEARLKFKNLSFEEVVHHPTVHLRVTNRNDEILRHYGSREKENLGILNPSGRRASGSLVDDFMQKNKHLNNMMSYSRPCSDIASGNGHSPLTHASLHDANAHARSLEKILTELQCGLSYTQAELNKTKSDLKVAKEQIDNLCATQNSTTSQVTNNNHDVSRGERKRFILKIRDK